MRRETLGRLLATLRLAGGKPHPTRSRGSRPAYATSGREVFTQEELAQAIQRQHAGQHTYPQVTKETIRSAERGEVRLESMWWLATLADILHLLPEERALLLAQSPYFDIAAIYATCWDGATVCRGMRFFLAEMVLPGWVHDPFGDLVLANEEALAYLGLARPPYSEPFYANLWHVLCALPSLLPQARQQMARHLRTIVFPYRTAPYWGQLMDHLYQKYASQIQTLWQQCAEVSMPWLPIEWRGRYWFWMAQPVYTQQGPLYMNLLVPLGSLPPRRRERQGVFSLIPWPDMAGKDPDGR